MAAHGDAEPRIRRQASGNVTVNLLVTSGNASDTETRTILHQPAVATRGSISAR